MNIVPVEKSEAIVIVSCKQSISVLKAFRVFFFLEVFTFLCNVNVGDGFISLYLFFRYAPYKSFDLEDFHVQGKFQAIYLQILTFSIVFSLTKTSIL